MKEITLREISKFDGMLHHSGHFKGRGRDAFGVVSQNKKGNYSQREMRLFTYAVSGVFEFVDSVGIIKLDGRGVMTPIIGSDYVYIYESGWTTPSDLNAGRPKIYALNYCGDKIWEVNIEESKVVDLVKLEDSSVLILSVNMMKDNNYSKLQLIDKEGNLKYSCILDGINNLPVIIDDNFLWVHHGSNLSRMNLELKVTKVVGFPIRNGTSWDRVIKYQSKYYFSVNSSGSEKIKEYDREFNLIREYKIKSSNHVSLNKKNGCLYFIVSGRELVVFSLDEWKEIQKTNLEFDFYQKPVIFMNCIMLYEGSRIVVLDEGLNKLVGYRTKGTITGVNEASKGVLQLLVSDYLRWDKDKSENCYSRLYQLVKV